MTIYEFSDAITRMRVLFQSELHFIEVPTQSRLSILAACEDPETISQFTFEGVNYPLPQTGQMWLERELLTKPDIPGVFCQSTSYRNEQNPIPGRHDLIFPMFEFESFGNVDDLKRLLSSFLNFCDLPAAETVSYVSACNRYGVDLIGAVEEARLQNDYGNSVMLERFPMHSQPFWNMKVHLTLANKVDVILHGVETIGSAERSSDTDEMYRNFHLVSDGKYAQLLYHQFGKERVESELHDYLSLPMVPRFGGGIGLTRFIRALKLKGRN